jgi:arylsulfatase
MEDTFAFSPWVSEQPELIDKFTVTPYSVVHPIQAYALRVEEHGSGATLAYSGDSAYTDALIEAARGVDVFLCEATWGETCEGKIPGMHICGQDAGMIAAAAGVKKLIVTHIPPWADKDATLAAAARYYDGPIELGVPGMQIDI